MIQAGFDRLCLIFTAGADGGRIAAVVVAVGEFLKELEALSDCGIAVREVIRDRPRRLAPLAVQCMVGLEYEDVTVVTVCR